jgi:hypothetical protein
MILKNSNSFLILKPGELLSWFDDWEVIYPFEGTIGAPPKAIARLVCIKAKGAQAGFAGITSFIVPRRAPAGFPSYG